MIEVYTEVYKEDWGQDNNFNNYEHRGYKWGFRTGAQLTKKY